jgi:hypothetical protein
MGLRRGNEPGHLFDRPRNSRRRELNGTVAAGCWELTQQGAGGFAEMSLLITKYCLVMKSVIKIHRAAVSR